MVDLSNLQFDVIALSLVSFLTYGIKIAFKPSEAEVRLIGKVLLGLSMLIVQLLRKWQSQHSVHFDMLLSYYVDLKKKINSNRKVKVG